MLCRKCNERELSPGKIRRHDYTCNHCCQAKNDRIHQRTTARLREELFNHYGKTCVYCGSDSDLQLDHTNGDGKECRSRTVVNRWFRFLIAEGFPPDCQVVCRQCNIAKQQMTDAQFREWIAQLYHRLNPIF